MVREDLRLSAQPLFSCCEHCKAAYCPDQAGHYGPCKFGGCETGHMLKMDVAKEKA